MSIFGFLKKCLRKLFRPTKVIVSKCSICQISANRLLNGKVALVTGGTSGIGKAIAKAFLRSGASVIITSRSPKRLNQAIEELSSESNYSGWINGLVLDNTQVESFPDKVRELVNIIHSNGGEQLDILVNNSGIIGGHISNCSELEYDAVMNTNLKGTFFLSRCIGQYMKENHIQGNILNITSSSSLRHAVSAYTMTKWALNGLTIGLAKVMIPHGIVVNGLAPGPTATPMLKSTEDENMHLPSSPSGRWAHPVEIANMAVMLVSDAGRMIVGDTIYMTGGAGIITLDDMKYYF